MIDVSARNISFCVFRGRWGILATDISVPNFVVVCLKHVAHFGPGRF